jgi:hypothetical protein
MAKAPPAAPLELPPDHRLSQHQVRLLTVISRTIETTRNSADRGRFSYLCDLLVPQAGGEWKLPWGRPDNKAADPNHPAVLYAAVLHAIKLLWAGASTQAIEPVVALAERIAAMEAGTKFRFVGSQGRGWQMEFPA